MSPLSVTSTNLGSVQPPSVLTKAEGEGVEVGDVSNTNSSITSQRDSIMPPRIKRQLINSLQDSVTRLRVNHFPTLLNGQIPPPAVLSNASLLQFAQVQRSPPLLSAPADVLVRNQLTTLHGILWQQMLENAVAEITFQSKFNMLMIQRGILSPGVDTGQAIFAAQPRTASSSPQRHQCVSLCQAIAIQSHKNELSATAGVQRGAMHDFLPSSQQNRNDQINIESTIIRIQCRNERKEKRWMQRYEELLQFQQKHGHCRVPHGFLENRKLSWWVMNQRAQYNLLKVGKRSWLTQDRVTLLDAIGFDWNLIVRKSVCWSYGNEGSHSGLC